MTTIVSARNTIASYIATKFATDKSSVKIFFENTEEIDLDAQGDMFVLCVIDFTDINRLNIDSVPMTRSFGEVIIRVFTREGLGVKDHLGMFDYVISILSHASLTGVTFETASPGPKQKDRGWLMADVLIPFYFF